MGWLKDDPLPPDVQDVLDAAALLEVTEFHLFELAFRDWHGEAVTVERIEPPFVAYMFQGIVPFWVRQFTRKVLRNRRADGEIDHGAFGVQRRGGRPQLMRAAGFATAVLAVLLILLITAISAGYLPPFLQECYFPPCY